MLPPASTARAAHAGASGLVFPALRGPHRCPVASCPGFCYPVSPHDRRFLSCARCRFRRFLPALRPSTRAPLPPARAASSSRPVPPGSASCMLWMLFGCVAAPDDGDDVSLFFYNRRVASTTRRQWALMVERAHAALAGFSRRACPITAADVLMHTVDAGCWLSPAASGPTGPGHPPSAASGPPCPGSRPSRRLAPSVASGLAGLDGPLVVPPPAGTDVSDPPLLDAPASPVYAVPRRPTLCSWVHKQWGRPPDAPTAVQLAALSHPWLSPWVPVPTGDGVVADGVFSLLLPDHPHSALLDCMSLYGWDVAVDDPRSAGNRRDLHASARAALSDVVDWLESETKLGHMVRIDPVPGQLLEILPLGAVPKGAGWRPTTDASWDPPWPGGVSLNALSPPPSRLRPLRLLTHDEVQSRVRALSAEGSPLAYAKVDVAGAYRTVPLSRRAWFRVAHRVNGVVRLHTRLAFGLAASGDIFCMHSNWVCSYMATQGVWVSAFIDDFLTLGPAASVDSGADLLLRVLFRVGLSPSRKKWLAEGATTSSGSILGVHYDLRAQTVSITEDKRTDTLASLAAVRDGSITVGGLASLAGRLRWFSAALPLLRPSSFALARTLAASASRRDPRRARVSALAQLAAQVAAVLVGDNRPVSFARDAGSPALCLSSDACMSGSGIASQHTSPPTAIAFRHGDAGAGSSINRFELAAAVVAAAVGLEDAARRRLPLSVDVVVLCDNLNSVAAASSGAGAASHVPLLLSLALLQHRHRRRVRLHHLAGRLNAAADGLSRSFTTSQSRVPLPAAPAPRLSAWWKSLLELSRPPASMDSLVPPASTDSSASVALSAAPPSPASSPSPPCCRTTCARGCCGSSQAGCCPPTSTPATSRPTPSSRPPSPRTCGTASTASTLSLASRLTARLDSASSSAPQSRSMSGVRATAGLPPAPHSSAQLVTTHVGEASGGCSPASCWATWA